MHRYRAIEWVEVDGAASLRLLDQTALPQSLQYVDCRTVADVWDAIKTLKVRGAPAIGVAAAYGLLLSRSLRADDGVFSDAAADDFFADAAYLKSSRPTAVNLFWALDRMLARFARERSAGGRSIRASLLDEARAVHAEDAAMCRAIGRHGAELIRDGDGILTHCNTGGLATSEFGTALSVVLTAHQQGKRLRVFADETRPLLQGSRLTMWELQQCGVPSTLICDSMAAQVMREGKVQAVIVGADRITARGDAANKIGTYSVAIAAQYHGIPFYVAAPSSTFDLSLEAGDQIPIEQRGEEEVVCGFGRRTAPEGVEVYNPAFDVTPAELISGIITEYGVIATVDRDNIEWTLRGQRTAPVK